MTSPEIHPEPPIPDFGPDQQLVYHLEMHDPAQLVPRRDPTRTLHTTQAKLPCPALNRFFYREVGRAWHWVDRLTWSDQQWMAYLGRDEQETWMVSLSGTPIGFFELEIQAGGRDIELVYFGLLPQFIGRGLGGPMLTCVIEQMWSRGPKRIWLHTCSDDHPAALANYRARGFRLFRYEVEERPSKPEREP